MIKNKNDEENWKNKTKMKEEEEENNKQKEPVYDELYDWKNRKGVGESKLTMR